MRQFLVLPSNPHFVHCLKGVVCCLSVVRFVNHANGPPYSLWNLRNYLKVFKNHNCNPFQSSSSLSSVSPFDFAVIFTSFHVFSSYFYVSLSLVVVPTGFDKFRDTAPLSNKEDFLQVLTVKNFFKKIKQILNKYPEMPYRCTFQGSACT